MDKHETAPTGGMAIKEAAEALSSKIGKVPLAPEELLVLAAYELSRTFTYGEVGYAARPSG